MFDKSVDERISEWRSFRIKLGRSKNPFQDVVNFWAFAPYIVYNRKIDPYNKKSWPTPWEIIEDNKYDDFTKALMMAWTLSLTEKFKNSSIEIRTYSDQDKKREYNVVVVDSNTVLNFTDDKCNLVSDIPESFILENLIQVEQPR
jgi:hypothetical protein